VQSLQLFNFEELDLDLPIRTVVPRRKVLNLLSMVAVNNFKLQIAQVALLKIAFIILIANFNGRRRSVTFIREQIY